MIQRTYISDKITSYTDYVHNLDKLTVYVTSHRIDDDTEDDNEVDDDDDDRSRKHRSSATGDSGGHLGSDTKCASISRRNNALFNPRVHFECPEARRGRYVYVKATGVPDRWRKLFTVVLCEVEVY